MKGRGARGQRGTELALQHFEGPLGLPLGLGLSDADQRCQAVAQGSDRFLAHEVVALVVILAALAVTAENPGAPRVHQLGP